MTKNSLVITIVAAVIVGALGFYGGIQYQKSQRGSFPGGAQGFPNGNGQQTRTGNSLGSRPISGEITSLDENTLTIQTQDGSSKIVIYSTSTTINKTSEGSAADLEIGGQVMIIGSESTDGTVTAQTISLGGEMFQGGPNGQPADQNGQ